MPVAHGSFNSLTFGVRTNTTVTAPTGIVDGNLLLFLLFMQNDPDVSATAPTGFSPVAGYTAGLVVSRQGADNTASSKIKLYAWWKRASGESGNYTASHSSTTTAAYCGRYTGGATGGGDDPTDGPQATANSGTSSTIVATGATAREGAMVVFACGVWDSSGATSPPTGTTPTFTERLELFGTAFYVADGPLTASGATGNKSPSTGPAANGWLASLIFLEPTKAPPPYQQTWRRVTKRRVA